MKRKDFTDKHLSRNPELNLSNCKIFFDFDNTLTKFDVLDDIIQRFSADKEWMKFEKAWMEGKIGSRECLKNQLKSVRVTRRALSNYLSGIKLDSHFSKILTILKARQNDPVILSDSFSFMIKYILRNNGIRGVKIYSNKISFSNDRLIPSFPYKNKDCLRCAHCKKQHFFNNGINIRNKKIIYIGDGLSDVCAARHADLVFAKGSLLDYFKKARRKCLTFEDLGDVYKYLQGVNQWT